MRLVSTIRLEQDGLAGLVEWVLWKRLGRKKISMKIWWVVVLEVDRVWLVFTFGVFILKKSDVWLKSSCRLLWEEGRGGGRIVS